MTTTMINTSRGAKSPAEALELFKLGGLPAGDLLGILRQLKELGLRERQEAAQHVLANKSSYNTKIQALAQEITTGLPVGAKRLGKWGDLERMLGRLPCGTVLEVTLHRSAGPTRYMEGFLQQPILQIDESTRALLGCVARTGEWQHVSPKFMATLATFARDEVQKWSFTLDYVIQTVEVKSVPERKAPKAHPLSDEVKAILVNNPDLIFDQDLFREVCIERGFITQLERIGELTHTSTMEQVLMLFHGNMSREEFLEYYILKFNAIIGA
jgi:hypothetical protein